MILQPPHHYQIGVMVGATKVLNFHTPTNFTVNIMKLKLETERFYMGVISPNDSNGKANSENPDQTALLRIVI